MNMRPALLKTFLALIIFAVSIAAYYYPMQKKGHVALGDFLNVSAARNFAVADTFNYESGDGVLLSTKRAKSEAKIFAIPNPLTSILYGQIFKYFPGKIDYNLVPSYASILLAGVFNVLIFLLIARLFDAKIGFISSMAMTLMPMRITGALYYGLYEFGMLFFAVALWSYLGSRDGPFKAGTFGLFISGTFFALAALARSAFSISFVPFILFDFYKNRSYRRILSLGIPFLILFGSTLTPYSWLNMPNGYTTGIDAQPFSQLSHVFNDPYSAYYNRDSVLNGLENKNLTRLQTHFLKLWGYDVGWGDRLSAYKASATYYIVKTLDLTNFGGPLVVLLMAVGAYWLYRNKRDMLWLFSVWVVVWFLGLVSFETGNWDHYLELAFIAALLTGLGTYQLWQWMSAGTGAKGRAHLGVGAILTVLLFGHFIYADKWKLYDVYRSSYMGTVLDFSDTVSEIKNKGVIAAGIHPDFASGLYYLTDRDIVYFSTKTVKELLASGNLKDVFEVYGIQTAVGFSEDISTDIQRMTRVDVIPWDGKRE